MGLKIVLERYEVVLAANTAGANSTYELLLNDIVLAKTVTVGANDSTIIQLKQPLTATQTIKGLASAVAFLSAKNASLSAPVSSITWSSIPTIILFVEAIN